MINIRFCSLIPKYKRQPSYHPFQWERSPLLNLLTWHPFDAEKLCTTENGKGKHFGTWVPYNDFVLLLVLFKRYMDKLLISKDQLIEVI